MKWQHKSVFFLLFVVVAGLLIGVWSEKNVSPTKASAPNLQSGTAFPVARSLPEFNLIDQNNQAFTNKRFKNNWSLVFFGYTHCPEICPITLGHINSLAEILGPKAMMRYVFVSINPSADTPEQLKAFFTKDRFKHADFMAATGNADDIQMLAKTIGLYVSEENVVVNGHIEHSGTVLLVNPEGKLAAIFTDPSDAFAMARDFRIMIRNYQG